MAKRIRALVRGAKRARPQHGLQNPFSPHNLQRSRKGEPEAHEKRPVILANEIRKLFGKSFTGRARRKAVEKLRRLRQAPSAV